MKIRINSPGTLDSPLSTHFHVVDHGFRQRNVQSQKYVGTSVATSSCRGCLAVSSAGRRVRSKGGSQYWKYV